MSAGAFAYVGRDGTGAKVEGVLEGASPNVVADQLRARGITPVSIKAAAGGQAGGGDKSGAWLEGLLKPRIPAIEIMLFSRQLYTLLKAGVPIMQALTGLGESTPNKTMAGVITDVRDSLEVGRDLSASLARHPRVFSSFYLSMVRVGEQTGRLEEIFLRLYHHLEFEKFMREQVKSALRYPMFVVAAMVLAMGVINVFVIPSFSKVFKGMNAKLPPMTELLIGLSDFTVRAWPWLLAGLCLAIAGFIHWTRTPSGQLLWDRAKLSLPVAGKIVRKATLARFARSFSLALRSGVPVVQAMTVVAQTADNAYMSDKVARMRESVERGESVLRTATAAKVFTPTVLQMIAVGEESGALDELLQEVAELYQQEVEYELKTLSAQIEPILIVFLGAMILVLALGVFMPMWELGRASMQKG